MRVVIQRVKYANVNVEGETVGKIDTGLLVLADLKHQIQQRILNGLQ